MYYHMWLLVCQSLVLHIAYLICVHNSLEDIVVVLLGSVETVDNPVYNFVTVALPVWIMLLKNG